MNIQDFIVLELVVRYAEHDSLFFFHSEIMAHLKFDTVH